jgi:hypothetical protein
LQARLLQSGQVRVAVVARRFPDVLAVTIEERGPVLRVRAPATEGAERHLFAARDGFIFSGEGYALTLIESLPWLEGVTLERDRTGRGFAPLTGLNTVSDLLGTARASAPELARSFTSVSLARFAADGVLIVHTPEVKEIVFGTRDDFYRQLARLDYILDEIRAKPGAAPVRSINLSIGGRQVPVAFEAPPPASETRTSRAAPIDLATPGITFFRL